jgi:hypothetical protein
VTFSLNEIEVMGKRAARGAGLSWGLAEEAGKAARWLAARALPGPEELADNLIGNDGKTHDELAPVSLDGVWRARAGRLSPLVCGAALCDLAAEIAAGREIEFGATAQPLLLAPYAAGVAKMTDTAVELSWPGVVMTFASGGVSIDGDHASLLARSAKSVRCRRTETAVISVSADTASGRAVDARTWHRLNELAQRTFAPATEESRLAGAGAGLTDND